MSNQIVKADPSDAGCWIDGHWGIYGTTRLISIAKSYGWSLEDDSDLIHAINCWENNSNNQCFNDDWCSCSEIISDVADEAENWLNDNVAPEDFSFGWHDGEFFLQSIDWWNEYMY